MELLKAGVGLVLGWLVFDVEKVLARYLDIPVGVFREFRVFGGMFVVAVFVITATDSALGKGLVLGLLAHGMTTLTDKIQKRMALGLLGLALSLVLL